MEFPPDACPGYARAVLLHTGVASAVALEQDVATGEEVAITYLRLAKVRRGAAAARCALYVCGH